MQILKDYAKSLFTAFIGLTGILILLSFLAFFPTLEISALKYGIGLQ